MMISRYWIPEFLEIRDPFWNIHICPETHEKSIHYWVRFSWIYEIFFVDLFTFSWIKWFRCKYFIYLFFMRLFWKMTYIFWKSNSNSGVLSDYMDIHVRVMMNHYNSQFWPYGRLNYDYFVHSASTGWPIFIFRISDRILLFSKNQLQKSTFTWNNSAEGYSYSYVTKYEPYTFLT